MTYPSSFTLNQLITEKESQIHQLSLKGEEVILEALRFRTLALIAQLPTAYAREAEREKLDKAVEYAKDIAEQQVAYRYECERVAQLIKAEKREKKRIAKQECDSSVGMVL
ncbi:hypothetical protein WNY58_16620 [Neptuniibacter pectenicola]|uniref:Uncharacterized protein n=1 Tax=Neptuniibacter pectenicola TaxID=1806669 RepID=A0ABU9TX07_9GAMM